MSQPGQIYALMGKVMADIDAIEKERRNTQGSGYNFRGIDDVYNAMHPIFAKHGVFSVPTVLERVREERKSNSGGTLIYTMLTVKYTFYAPDGSSVDAVCVGEAFDSGDKSSNKAMSAAQKYAILQTFCVPTVEAKDTENDSPHVAPLIVDPPAHPTRPAPPPVVLPKANKGSQPTEAPRQETRASGVGVTDKQRKMLWARLKSLDISDDEAKDFLVAHSGKESSKNWTRQDFDKVLAVIETLEKKASSPVEDWNP